MSRSDEDRRRAPRSRWRPLLWGIVLSLLFGGGSLVAWAWLARPTAAVSRASAIADTRPGVGVLEKLDVYGHVPDFSLIERSGRRVGRSDLLGKIWVVDFFYTRCTDTCPLQSAHMARLQADLSGQRDVRLVSISIDPEHDTPKVLIAYARRFRADPDRWLFLTGSRAAIYQLAVDGFHLGVAESGRTAQQAKGGGWARLGAVRGTLRAERPADSPPPQLPLRVGGPAGADPGVL